MKIFSFSLSFASFVCENIPGRSVDVYGILSIANFAVNSFEIIHDKKQNLRKGTEVNINIIRKKYNLYLIIRFIT